MSSEDVEISGFLDACRQAWREGEARPADTPDQTLFEASRGKGGSSLLPPTFGPYRDCVEIARGGMGVVHRGRDVRLNRPVAIKVVRGELAGSKRALWKFVTEAQVTAQLEHPGIVPVHELDSGPDGQAYFTMQLVRGRSLAALLAEAKAADPWRAYPLARRLGDFLKICEAVHFAHSRGVLHRDLKPENVMVGEFGEVFVMDWGLAKIRGGETPGSVHVEPAADSATPADPGVTADGAVVGTLYYMSPEQALGAIDEVDEASDVYALGAMLYEMLTLARAFDGPRSAEVRARILLGGVVPPTEVPGGSRVPRDLEAVVLRAMELRKEDRYRSAGELKEEIEAFLEGRALRAVRYTPLERAAKWVARHRGVSAVGALAGIVLAAVVAWSYVRIDRERREALARRDEAERARAETEALLAERVRRDDADRRVASAEVAFARAWAYSYSPTAEAQFVGSLADRARGEAEAALATHPDHVGALTLLGRIDESEGRYASAEARWTRVLHLDPGNASARRLRASLLLSRCFLSMLAEAPGSDDESLPQAEGIARTAVAELRAAIAAGPLDGGGEVELGVAEGLLAFAGGDVGRTGEVAEEGIQLLSGRPGVERFYWLAGMAEVDPEAKVEAFDRALEISPHDPLILLCRAMALARDRRPFKAIEDFERMQVWHPFCAESYCYWARTLLRGKDLESTGQAISHLQRALELDPGLGLAHFLLGIAHIDLGRYDEAIADFDRTFELRPDAGASIHFFRGRAHLLAGRRAQAEAEYGRALELGGDDFRFRRKIKADLGK